MEKTDISPDRFMTVEKFINDLIVFHGEIQKLKASESYYKKLADTCQESEKNCKSILENLPGKIFLKDKDGKYTFCNVEFARGFEVTPEKVIGKSDFDFFQGEFAENMVNNDKKIMEKGGTEESEEEFFYDGRKITGNFVRTPFKNESGDVVGLLGVFWDITEKKEKEEEIRRKCVNLENLLGRQKNELEGINAKYERELAECGALREKYSNLRNSFDAQVNELNGINAKYQKELAESGVLREKIKKLEENYRALLENSEAAIVVIKENAIISTMNEGFEKLAGLPRIEVEGRMSIKDFFANEDLGKVNEILSSAGGTYPTNGKNEFNLLDRNKTVKVVSMYAHPITNGNLLFLKDITSHKQAEGKLRNAISQFRELMNEMEKTLDLN